jgi:hypothetical protein
VEAGKDVEYWGGHYGAKFQNEIMMLVYATESKNIS